ncbi:hypothetical protein BH11CYA1_BH11CYA1_34470 [soil metagenome]
MTYRFDKSGKRIPAGTAQDKLVAAAENRDIKSNGLQNSATAQRSTGTSHLVQTQRSAAANQKLARKGADADLSKPLRHIGMAIAAVISIVIIMAAVNMAGTMLAGMRGKTKHANTPPPVAARSIHRANAIAPAPLKNLGHWSKAEMLKNLYAACQKAHAARNYSAENTILKNLSESSPAETKAMLEKLLAANGKNLQYQWQLAVVLYHSGNLAQAKVVNDKLLLQIKGSHQSLELQGLAYTLEGRMKARAGHDQEAIQDLTTAVSLFEKAKLPDSVFVDTLRNIAWLELRTGRRMQAAALFERVNACTSATADSSDETANAETYMMRNIQ